MIPYVLILNDFGDEWSGPTLTITCVTNTFVEKHTFH